MQSLPKRVIPPRGGTISFYVRQNAVFVNRNLQRRSTWTPQACRAYLPGELLRRAANLPHSVPKDRAVRYFGPPGVQSIEPELVDSVVIGASGDGREGSCFDSLIQFSLGDNVQRSGEARGQLELMRIRELHARGRRVPGKKVDHLISP